MPRTFRRRSARRGQRRRVDTARFGINIGAGAGVVDVQYPLSTWMGDHGITTPTPVHPDGVTVGGIRYRLSVETAAAQAPFTVTWGFIVAPAMITTAADFGPSVHQHLDWMEWGQDSIDTQTGAARLHYLVGGGDNGFRTTRSRRKLDEIEDSLVFAFVAPIACTYHLFCSVAVMFP